MLEIDGEFFEDPCETIIAARMYEAILIGKMAATQMALVMAQPLFTSKFANGEIVYPSTLKGDNKNDY